METHCDGALGVLAGLFIALGEWPGAIIVLLGLHELSKRESDKA